MQMKEKDETELAKETEERNELKFSKKCIILENALKSSVEIGRVHGG